MREHVAGRSECVCGLVDCVGCGGSGVGGWNERSGEVRVARRVGEECPW